MKKWKLTQYFKKEDTFMHGRPHPEFKQGFELIIIVMLVNDWLINKAGTLLIVTGLLGIIVDVSYDKYICQRGASLIHFGPMQWLFVIYCIFIIYAGIIYNNFIDGVGKE